MQIVWDQTVVEQLKQSHTVLELETLEIQGQPLTAYCVVPSEKIALDKYATLEAFKEMHAQFVSALKQQNYQVCMDLVPLLRGEFGGELDSFYDIIVERIKDQVINTPSS